jgi:murein DD-endopeptidase MepM/ murein hydrolase activator NlpD
LPLLLVLLPDITIRIGARGHLSLFDLPVDARIESVLTGYLITEPIAAAGDMQLHPEIVRKLKISTYRIRAGDTLSEIANRYNLNLDTIISLNDITDARALRAGMKLEIPNSNGLRYRIKRGDSLARIAGAYGIKLEALVDWNNLESAVIRPGQELFIPGARLSTNALNRVLGKLFIYPTKGRITSRFGYRKNPFSGVREFHNGLDIGNFVGTPVAATMAGTVARIGYYPWLGKYVILSHPDGFQSLYGHLSKVMVSRGKRISQGQKIAEMGNTGYSTGPHLHFAIFKNSTPVDPLKYLH